MQVSKQNKKTELINAMAKVITGLKNAQKRSARSLALETNMSKTTLLLAETGRLDPQFTTFCKIAEAFYLKPEKFIQMIYAELPEDWSILE